MQLENFDTQLDSSREPGYGNILVNQICSLHRPLSISGASTSIGGAVNIRRGDIFWVEPDEERGSALGVPHPHVVVQDDLFNRSRISTVVVCALTTNLKRAQEPGNVLLEPGEANLARQSVVVVSQVSSVQKSHLGEYIGTLSTERVEQILAGMRFQQAAFFSQR
jgi:mRNA interferase MazF